MLGKKGVSVGWVDVFSCCGGGMNWAGCCFFCRGCGWEGV